MYSIPIPKWQSLSAARRYVEKLAPKGTHSTDVESSLLAAFREGTLEVRAQRYDDDTDTYNLETIPTAFWQDIEAHHFHSFLNNDGNTIAYARIDDDTPRYKNAQIQTASLDKWLGIKKGGAPLAMPFEESSIAKKFNLVTNAPTPMRAASGNTSAFKAKKIYDTTPTDDDYLRCITDGNIKVHRLAALACDLSPAGNLSEDRLYVQNLYDSNTRLGLIFDKLRYAVETKKLRIVAERSSMDRHLINLVEGMNWLAKEGVAISERLKNYAKSSTLRAPTEHAKSTFITATQAVSWIAFSDFDTINRTLTDAESEKLELAKSNFLKRAQAGNLNIYGVNPKHTGSATASNIVPRGQILNLVSLGNHLMYKGENWTNLELEKSKVLELWPAGKSKSSNSLDADISYAIPNAPAHERANISIGEAVSWMMYGDYDAHNQRIEGSEDDFHKQFNANVQKLLDAASVGQLSIWAENNGNKPCQIDDGTLKLRMKHYVVGDNEKQFPHNDELIFVHGESLDSWSATQIRRDAFMNWRATSSNSMPAPVMPSRKSGRNKGDGSFVNKDAPFILLAEKEWPHDSANKAAEKLVKAHAKSIEGQSDASKIERLRKRISKYRKGGLDLNGFEPFRSI